MMNTQAQEVASILKTIAHPKRFLILCKLLDGPKTVSDLEKYCTIGQSQLSQFLSRMKDEEILTCTKRGQYVWYAIADVRVGKLIKEVQRIFCNV